MVSLTKSSDAAVTEQFYWERFLDQRYCSADSATGNRPCDDGACCSACMSFWAQAEFKKFMAEVLYV
jgi:hypothetical protein